MIASEIGKASETPESGSIRHGSISGILSTLCHTEWYERGTTFVDALCKMLRESFRLKVWPDSSTCSGDNHQGLNGKYSGSYPENHRIIIAG